MNGYIRPLKSISSLTSRVYCGKIGHMIMIKSNYRYWSLIKELAITDFKLKYQGSVFGYFWSLMKPLAYFGVLYIVFTKIFKIGGSIPYYPVYLLLGVMMFGFWGEATSGAMLSIASKGDLIRKVYFPRIVLVIASSLASLMTFFLNLFIVFLFALVLGVPLGVKTLLIFLVILEFYFFVLGVSFYLGALFVKYRDVGHIWEVFNQILFYATPIVYPLSLVPLKYAKIMILSPFAQIMQDMRGFIIGSQNVLTVSDYWAFYFIPHLLVIFIFVTGYYLFQKMAAKFAEEV